MTPLFFRSIFIAASLTAISTPASFGTILGQPLLVAEANTDGGVLDFFDVFGPSGLKNVDASATITSTVGSDNLIGEEIEIFAGPFSDATLTIGGIAPVSLFPIGGFFDSFTLDDFQDGVISLEYGLAFDLDFSTDPVTGDDIFTFLDPFGAFSPEPGVGFPEITVGVNIYYNGDLPTRFFDDGFGGFDYVEGTLDVDRIELGVIGGPAVPVSTVPLPATLPLALFGFGMFGLVCRKRQTA